MRWRDGVPHPDREPCGRFGSPLGAPASSTTRDEHGCGRFERVKKFLKIFVLTVVVGLAAGWMYLAREWVFDDEEETAGSALYR